MAIMDDDEYMDELPPKDPPAQSDGLPTSSAATSIAMDPQTVQSKTPQAILDYFNQKKQALASAQQETRDNQEGTGLTSALVQLGHGISRAPGSADLSAVNAMGKNDDQPLKNLAQQDQLEGSDPETPQAAALRKVYAPIFQKAGMDPNVLEGMGADQIKQYAQSPLELREKMMTSQANHELAQAAKQGLSYDRESKAHDAYLTHVEDKEAGWRSDPATTRFDQNLAAVSSADAILQKYRGREDAMPIQDIHTLVADKLRAMTGAAPTEPEISAQLPHNVHTMIGGAKSFITGSPEPANAGDFVKNIDSYFKDIESKSLAGVKNRQQTIASDPRLTAQERARVVQIGVPQPVYAENGGQSRAPQSAPGGQAYSPDVVNYAQSHNITQAQAQAIKQQRGGQ